MNRRARAEHAWDECLGGAIHLRASPLGLWCPGEWEPARLSLLMAKEQAFGEQPGQTLLPAAAQGCCSTLGWDSRELCAEIPADLWFICWINAWKCPPKSPPCTNHLSSPMSSATLGPSGASLLAGAKWHQCDEGKAREVRISPTSSLPYVSRANSEIQQSELI